MNKEVTIIKESEENNDFLINKKLITHMDVIEALFEFYKKHQLEIVSDSDKSFTGNEAFTGKLPSNYIEFTAYGRKRGWLEEQDLTYASLKIDRRSLARIIHEFIRIELGVTDINDWSNAKKLKDLYDCRVCAKHIAQMVERKLMPPRERDRFGLLDRVFIEELDYVMDSIADMTINNKKLR